MRFVDLAARLLGRDDTRCWSGSVVALGTWAGADAVDRLIAFIESDAARELDHRGYEAIAWAHRYLGILGRRHPEAGDRILAYLGAQIEEANHVHRRFGWTTAHESNRRAMHASLRSSALMGVASLGSQNAHSVLRRAETDPAFDPALVRSAFRVWRRSR